MSTEPSQRDLDPSLYDLAADELEFYKSATGIQDENELNEHILRVQAKAYQVCLEIFYGCPPV